MKAKMKLKKYKEVNKELEKLNKNNEAEILIIKARLNEKMNNLNEAAINYEQAAKYGSSEVSTLALYKLAKFRARQKDFYEALFDIKRIQKKPSKKIALFNNFIDGVISI